MKNSPEISRRRFLQSAVTTAGVATVPVALTGCFGDDDDNDRTAPHRLLTNRLWKKKYQPTLRLAMALRRVTPLRMR